jgi:hypothetical protein
LRSLEKDCSDGTRQDDHILVRMRRIDAVRDRPRESFDFASKTGAALRRTAGRILCDTK